MTVSVATRLMIVNVSISQWEGRRLDKAITRKTIDDNQVQDADGLRVNKLLIERDAFKEMTAAASSIRTFLRERTLPWKDNGDRALMRQGYQLFMQDFYKLEQDWHAAVDHFITTKYPAARAKASFNLGDAYDPEDYPHPEELRTRFKLTLDIDAVAEAGDFRVKLDEDVVSEIKEKIEEAMAQRIQNAMSDVWARVATMVEHYADRTKPDIQRFHDTTVTNLQGLVGLMPSLNLLGDPNLKALAARLKDTLCSYDPKDLRKNPDVRASACADAQAIMDDMQGFMQAFKSN